MSVNKLVICSVGTSISNGCPSQKQLFHDKREWDSEPDFLKKEIRDSIQAKIFYSAPMENAARASVEERDIPLSPCAPVMAYTWGMAFQINPKLTLLVIDSSDPRKPPEEMGLTKTVSAMHVNNVEIRTQDSPADVVCHYIYGLEYSLDKE